MVKWNQLPTPGVLLTQVRPPIAATRRANIVSPALDRRFEDLGHSRPQRRVGREAQAVVFVVLLARARIAKGAAVKELQSVAAYNQCLLCQIETFCARSTGSVGYRRQRPAARMETDFRFDAEPSAG
jgi:hypothetical protein